MDLDLPFGLGIKPPAQYTAAWKHQRMGPVTVDHGEFKITVEGRAGRGFPHQKIFMPWRRPRLDLDHIDRLVPG
jgi:hypothetical protein